MSSPIGGVGQLVTIIRSQLAARTDNKTTQRTANRKLSKTRDAYASENLEALIGQRVKSIDPSDPHRGRKAFRIFLETLLLTLLSSNLMNDPKFHQLVDDVQKSMEADPQVRNLIDGAIQHLISGTPQQ